MSEIHKRHIAWAKLCAGDDVNINLCKRLGQWVLLISTDSNVETGEWR